MPQVAGALWSRVAVPRAGHVQHCGTQWAPHAWKSAVACVDRHAGFGAYGQAAI